MENIISEQKIQNNQPVIKAPARMWDEYEQHLLANIDDYFKQGYKKVKMVICDDKTGKESASGILTPVKFYKSESWLKFNPDFSPSKA